MNRRSDRSRHTRETEIRVIWDLDQPGSGSLASGIGFLDHMLDTLARHSGTSLSVACSGDLHIDGHHSTEDIAIVMGQCLREALGEKRGIERFGHIAVPLDEALVSATIDLSGRPYCVCDLAIPAPMIGDFDCELVPEFFHALAGNACLCLHLHQMSGRNSHHIVEAAFKACARALRQAIRCSGDDTVPSTKGQL